MGHVEFDMIFVEHVNNSFELILQNELTGEMAEVYVCPTHTIRQVVERYHDMIDLHQNQVSLCLEYLNAKLEHSLINRAVGKDRVSLGKDTLFQNGVD